jgi:HEAT repeat protein
MRGYIFQVLAAAAVILSAGRASAELEEWIRAVQQPGKTSERAAALVAIRGIAKDLRALSAVPAILSCLRDKEATVREEAVAALGSILYLQKQPCPLALVEMLNDSDADVRLAASTYGGIFSEYPEGSLVIFKKAARSPDRNLRSNAPHLLKVAGGNAPEVVRIMQELADDPDWQVANNAEIALWHVTKNVERFTLFCLRSIAAYRPVEGDAAKAENQQQAIRNLQAASLVGLLKQEARSQPVELSRALLKGCQHPTPEIRSQSIRTIAALRKEVEGIKRPLDEAGLQNVVRTLADDPEDGVRLALSNSGLLPPTR